MKTKFNRLYTSSFERIADEGLKLKLPIIPIRIPLLPQSVFQFIEAKFYPPNMRVGQFNVEYGQHSLLFECHPPHRTHRATFQQWALQPWVYSNAIFCNLL